MNIQFKKGVLELCVLYLLNLGDYYGYRLVQTISEAMSITGGTIYPLLRRLNKEGYFTTYLQESAEGPSRKYYSLTDKGKLRREELLTDWQKFVQGVEQILSREE